RQQVHSECVRSRDRFAVSIDLPGGEGDGSDLGVHGGGDPIAEYALDPLQGELRVGVHGPPSSRRGQELSSSCPQQAYRPAVQQQRVHRRLKPLSKRILRGPGWPRQPPVGRSEEHTSELQSRFDLVCRLLLEKKKTERQAKILNLLI